MSLEIVRGRAGGCLGKLDGGAHLFVDLLLERGDRALARHAGLLQPAGQPFDRVLQPPGFGLLRHPCSPACRRRDGRRSGRYCRPESSARRRRARARRRAAPPSRTASTSMPSTVSDGMPKAVPRVNRVWPSGDVLDGGEFAEAVIFADEQHRQPPDRRHVHDLEQQALIERAVAEKGGRHLTAAAPLGAQRGAGGERNAAADDAGGAEIAVGRIEDVQRAAAAEAVAGAASHHLGHQAGRHRRPWPDNGHGRGDCWRSCRRRASSEHTPTATASCPAQRCTRPGMTPPAKDCAPALQRRGSIACAQQPQTFFG